MTGYSRQELVGKSCAIIRSDSCFDPQLTEKGKYCSLFQKGQLKRAKCALVKKDGSLLHVLKNAALLKDEKDTVVGGVETFVDISEVVAQERVIFRLRRELTREDSFHGI